MPATAVADEADVELKATIVCGNMLTASLNCHIGFKMNLNYC